jgi:hypothetical protein
MRARRLCLAVAAVMAALCQVFLLPTAALADTGDTTWATRPADNGNGSGRAFFDYALAAGETVTDAIEVENRGDAPLTLQVYAADAFTTGSGTIDLAAGGTTPTDSGGWVTVSQPTVTVAPGRKVAVPFTVTVPAGAEPGDHPAGLVTSLTSGNGSTGVAVERRLGSRLYVRVPGNLAPAAAVDGVSASYAGTVNPVGSGSVEVTYRLTNTGNVRITPGETVQVRGLWGLLTSSGTTAAPMPDILPGSTITRTVRVDGVWPLLLAGAAVTVTPTPSTGAVPGLGTPVGASATVWALPWPQLVVVVLVVGLVLGWSFAVRHRRSAVQQRIDSAVRAARAEYGD